MNAEVRPHAADRLAEDARMLELAAVRIRDSITGAWECEGSPYVPGICSAADTIITAVGRLGHALEKAALEISGRAPDCYIDRLGEQTEATGQVRAIAADLLALGGELRDFPQRAHPKAQRLGSIGERETPAARAVRA